MAGGESGLRRVEDRYEGYAVYDNAGEKVGKVGAVYVEDDREEYLGVKTGLLGTRMGLVPMGIVRVNERERALEVAESKDLVKSAPAFGDDEEDITREHEDEVRRHFGVESPETSGGRAKRSRDTPINPDEENDTPREGEVRRRVRRRVRTEEVEDIEEESVEGEPERQNS